MTAGIAHRLHRLDERETPPNSVVQRLDARLRVLAVVLFALVVVSFQTIPPVAAALAPALFAAFAARLPFRETALRVLVMDAFMLVILALLPLTMPGTPLFTLWGIEASREGLERAVLIMLKANAVVLMLLALVGSMEPTALGHALKRLGMPDRLVHLLLFTARYVVVLKREYLRLRQAMRARAFVPRSTWHTWRSFGYLFGMLLVRALDRSERILAAMKCRGFAGRLHLIDTAAMGRRDAAFAVLFVATLGLLFVIAGQA